MWATPSLLKVANPVVVAVPAVCIPNIIQFNECFERQPILCQRPVLSYLAQLMTVDSAVVVTPSRRALPLRRRYISAPAARYSPPDDRKIPHRRPTKATIFPSNSKPIIVRKYITKRPIALAQNQRHSPSMEGADMHRFGDSPRSGSFNQSEVGIVDSLARPLRMSFGYA
ncbi:unnamed protein product [Strongylus vulgaris]|uniref:Uncharacterized protein n=1 Tax=Strongylus vulgaris TaxID=40348 RepID=A0A3P7ICL3_STRVU|nr:unnamed protein product [Strongylus vulgaris]